MNQPHSAEIIPFPRPAAGQPMAEDPAERLHRALTALDDALDRQRAAMAHWRFSLAALNHSVNGLGGSLGQYRHRLASLGATVAALHGTVEPGDR